MIWLINRDVLCGERDTRILRNGSLQDVLEVLRIDLQAGFLDIGSLWVASKVTYEAECELAPPEAKGTRSA